jgi:hypothetical protein
MHTISHSQIRKILTGLLLLGFFVFLVGAANLPVVHAQGGVAIQTPFFVKNVNPNDVPPDFTKYTPVDGATLQGTTVTLTWAVDGTISNGTYTDGTFYLHCVDKTNNGICDANIYGSDNDINRTLSNLDPGSTYYWQVWACRPLYGCRGANNGEWWSFTLAPVTFKSDGTKDGWVLESSKGSGVGGTMNSTATTFRLGDSAQNGQYRAILSFDTSTLPDTASITSAVLKIDQSGSTVGSISSLGSLFASIRNGYFSTNSYLQLADFNAPNTASKVAAFGVTPVSGWYSATLNSTGRSNINRFGLTQFRLFFNTATNNNNVADYRTFVSGDGTNQPQLIIKYSMP